MTTRKLFSEQKPRKPFAAWQGVFRPAFFLHELKRSWPRAICCFLTIFLAFPIPLLFSVSRRNYGEELARDFLNLMPFYAILAGALAALCGLWAMNYLHGKVSADAFHSLPLRRP